jgi:hypothetical protein
MLASRMFFTVFFSLSVVLRQFCSTAIVICPPGKKEHPIGSKKCGSLQNTDITTALNWMASPPTSKCDKLTTVQGISICEDNLPKDCLIWSQITSLWCDDIGSLEFEKYWSKRCDVVIFHYTSLFKGNVCTRDAGASWPELPRLSLVRSDMWVNKCFHCFYKLITPLLKDSKTIDVLKIQKRDSPTEDFQGVQFTVLSDIFLHLNKLSHVVQQVAMLTAYTPSTLTDRYQTEQKVEFGHLVLIYFN